MAFLRSEEEEKKDVDVYKKKAKNFEKKLQVLSTLKELSIAMKFKCVQCSPFAKRIKPVIPIVTCIFRLLQPKPVCHMYLLDTH